MRVRVYEFCVVVVLQLLYLLNYVSVSSRRGAGARAILNTCEHVINSQPEGNVEHLAQLELRMIHRYTLLNRLRWMQAQRYSVF